MIAWQKVTQTIVYADEYAILRSMDLAFCRETNKELVDYRVRQDEERRRQIEADKRKRR